MLNAVLRMKGTEYKLYESPRLNIQKIEKDWAELLDAALAVQAQAAAGGNAFRPDSDEDEDWLLAYNTVPTCLVSVAKVENPDLHMAMSKNSAASAASINASMTVTVQVL